MDYETKKLLEENLELARENNKILRKMRRSQVWGRLLTLLWWAIIIGVPVVLYYYVLQPYITDLSATYENVAGDLDGLPIADLLSRLNEFLGSFGGGEGATSTDSVE